MNKVYHFTVAKGPSNFEVITKSESELTDADKALLFANTQEQVANLPDGFVSRISDGYHTFNELYDHRIELFLTLCRITYDIGRVLPLAGLPSPWRSQKHSNGSIMEGWFIIGIWKEKGKQITYHFPMSRWEETNFMETLEKAPEWDGHSAADVLERLKQL